VTLTLPTPVCYQCGSSQLDDLGGVPAGRIFAGKPLTPAWAGGRLFRCANCLLVFRHPLRDQSDFDEKYRDAPSDVWTSGALRFDQTLVREQITRLCQQGSVLDIGCYDGALLRGLGGNYCKFGIEPSEAAAKVASRAGVEIVGESASALASLDRQFDVICAVDVIEHVRNPLDFVRQASVKLKPSGILLISTGNADATLWRLFGGRFWYCSAPEHIAFLSPSWAENAALELGLTLVEARKFRHHDERQGAWYRLCYGAKLLLQLAYSLFEKYLVFPFSSRARARGPRLYLGVPGLFIDHVLLVFRHRP